MYTYIFFCVCILAHSNILFIFFLEAFIYLMLSLESLFLMYILYTSPYSDIALTNIFSCFLTLIVLLEEPKFCILMKFNLLLFLAILVLCLRNICLFQVHSFFPMLSCRIFAILGSILMLMIYVANFYILSKALNFIHLHINMQF